MYDWSKTLAWLCEHPDAEPGGWQGADLFDMPLPPGFEENFASELDAEWTFLPYHDEQGEPSGAQFSIGETGYWVVMPSGRDPFIIDPEGLYIIE